MNDATVTRQKVASPALQAVSRQTSSDAVVEELFLLFPAQPYATNSNAR
jgi:hypothetical protein